MGSDKRKPAPLTPTDKFNHLSSVFGTRKLARLLGTRTSHLLAYSAREAPLGGRRLERLDTLHEVVSTLQASYNEIGIHDWFERKRASLGHLSARRVLEGTAWRKGDQVVRHIRKLARDTATPPQL